MHQVRAASLIAYVEVANFVGLDGAQMLRDAGINPADLEDHERRLAARPVMRLIERSARQSGCDAFGLLMAEARTFASLGPLSLLLERPPNVREVVRACVAFQRQLNDLVTISMEDDGETCVIRLDVVPEYWGAQVFDNAVGIAHRMLTGASGHRWTPGCVHLMRAPPQHPAPWRRYYSAPIEFGASFNGFSCASEAMLIPNPLANEEMADHARRLLNLVPVDRNPGAVADRVQRVIALLLPHGRASLEDVAAQLGLSPRNLQRRLAAEGETFATSLEAVRREMAVGYLDMSAHPITTIAALLGYATPSSFTRWFTRAFGQPPLAWRTAVASERGMKSPQGTQPVRDHGAAGAHHPGPVAHMIGA